MAKPKNNPLDSFVSETPSTTSVKLPPLPSLHEHVKEHGVVEGMKVHSEKMQEAWQQLERLINERTQGKPPLSSGKL